MQGTDTPDYARCVDIVTIGALKRWWRRACSSWHFRSSSGWCSKSFKLGAEAVAAFLMVATITGILMAIFFNTGGGAWDNAKKYIETGVYGGKRSDTHKASVVGDTVAIRSRTQRVRRCTCSSSAEYHHAGIGATL